MASCRIAKELQFQFWDFRANITVFIIPLVNLRTPIESLRSNHAIGGRSFGTNSARNTRLTGFPRAIKLMLHGTLCLQKRYRQEADGCRMSVTYAHQTMQKSPNGLVGIRPSHNLASVIRCHDCCTIDWQSRTMQLGKLVIVEVDWKPAYEEGKENKQQT